MRTARTVAAICLLMILWAPTPGALAYDLEDLLLNLYSKDGKVGVKLGGGSVEDGWGFPIDIEGGKINSAISGEIANLSLNSSVSAFSIAFDPVTGIPLTTTEALGPIYAERAQTLGKQGMLKFGASASHVKFTEYEGEDIDNVTRLLPHDDFAFPVVDPLWESDLLEINLDIDIEEYVIAIYGSYAILDNLDASVIVPFIDLDMKINSMATVWEAVEWFNPETQQIEIIHERREDGTDVHRFDLTGANGDLPTDSVSGDAYGIGDVIFRLKYFWREFERADIAFAADLKVPTGDEKNLLGADAFTLSPFVILSKTMFNGRFNPHLNFGYEINFDDSEFSQLEYLVGFDSAITEKVSVALDIIGNNELSGDDVGDNLYDVSVGIKLNPWSELILFGNIQVPINDEGLRADFIPSVGFEYSF